MGWNIWGSGGFAWVHEVVICSTSGSHLALIGGGSGQPDINKQTSNVKTKKRNIKNRRTSQKTRMIADDEMERKRRNILSK